MGGELGWGHGVPRLLLREPDGCALFSSCAVSALVEVEMVVEME